MSSLDLQIMGHGLAGAILAEAAVQAGLRVRVWDDGGPSSSRVAAGLFTPLTGKRLNPCWALDEALPHVSQFYPHLEALLGQSLYHPMPICRIFRSDSQQQECLQKAAHTRAEEMDLSGLPLKAAWGGLKLTGGGWVNLPVMLDALRERRQSRGEWGHAESDAKLTVWAEGARAAKNPLWQDVGWRNAHGDVLTLHIPGLAQDQIYNFGTFLVPIGQEQFRCGATYTWDHDCPAPRDRGRQELEAELHQVLQIPFSVLSHHAGIRPVAIARVPIVGPHPERERDWIFNGFGSKGVLYAPWMAQQLLQHINEGHVLPPETWAPRRIQRQRDRMATARRLNKNS